MNKLCEALQRLYFSPDQPLRGIDPGEAAPELKLISLDGTVRAMGISFERSEDWARVSKLYQAVQEELELPAPAISVSGSNGYLVLFSLAEPIAAEEARLFLNALGHVYLHDMSPRHLSFFPNGDASSSAKQNLLIMPPALDEKSGKWSAFIDPGMGSMFIEEPGLEMAPNSDRQADLLAGLKSIKATQFQQAMNVLQARDEAVATPSEQTRRQLPADADRSGNPVAHLPSVLNVGSNFSDPKSFLLAVMNDQSASAEHRIEAAKALLPYVEKNSPK